MSRGRFKPWMQAEILPALPELTAVARQAVKIA